MHEMRPLGVGETLDAAIAICRRCYRRLVLIAAVVVIPVQVLSALLLVSAGFDSDTTFTDDMTIEEFTSAVTALVVAGIISALLLALATAAATAASTKLVADTYLAEPGTVGDSMRFAFRRTLPLLGAAILSGLATGVGMYVCGPVGVWLAVSWSVFIPVLLVEGTGPVEALKRSFALTRSRWFSTFGLLAVVFLLQTTLALILLVVATILLPGASFDDSFLVNGLVGGLSHALTLPITASTLVVWYFDLRVRREGFDVLLMIRGLDRALTAP